jgi:uridylate kinase
VGNEENRYPALDLNKTIVNITKRLRDVYKKKPSKKKSGKKYLRNSWS